MDQACVLHREKPLRDLLVEKHGKSQGSDRHQQGERLMVEHPGQQPAVLGDKLVEPLPALARHE